MGTLTVAGNTGMTDAELETLRSYPWPFDVTVAKLEDVTPCIEFRVVDSGRVFRSAIELQSIRSISIRMAADSLVLAVDRWLRWFVTATESADPAASAAS